MRLVLFITGLMIAMNVFTTYGVAKNIDPLDRLKGSWEVVAWFPSWGVMAEHDPLDWVRLHGKRVRVQKGHVTDILSGKSLKIKGVKEIVQSDTEFYREWRTPPEAFGIRGKQVRIVKFKTDNEDVDFFEVGPGIVMTPLEDGYFALLFRANTKPRPYKGECTDIKKAIKEAPKKGRLCGLACWNAGMYMVEAVQKCFKDDVQTYLRVENQDSSVGLVFKGGPGEFDLASVLDKGKKVKDTELEKGFGWIKIKCNDVQSKTFKKYNGLKVNWANCSAHRKSMYLQGNDLFLKAILWP